MAADYGVSLERAWRVVERVTVRRDELMEVGTFVEETIEDTPAVVRE